MKKEQLVASRVSEEVVTGLKKVEEVEHLDRSTAIRRLLHAGLHEWKLQHAARLYQENRLTLAGAANEAGVSVREMMEYLRQKRVAAQYEVEDFERDLQGIAARHRAGRRTGERRTPASSTS